MRVRRGIAHLASASRGPPPPQALRPRHGSAAALPHPGDEPTGLALVEHSPFSSGVIRLLRAALVLAAVQQRPSTPSADAPQQVVQSATRAVEGDSVRAVAARWTARLARDSSDRAAVLGLATLADRTYDFKRADRLYGRLIVPRGRPPDEYAAYASLGRALMYGVQGRWREAEPWLRRAAADGRAVHDRRVEARARLTLAVTVGRLRGTAAEARALDSVAAILPEDDLSLQAAYRCQRASLIARTGGRNAAAEAWAGVALARRAHDLRFEGRCLHVIATDYVRQGDMDAAGTTLRQAEALLRRARDRAALAVQLQWHGYLLLTIGKYGPAQPLLQEAVAEAEASGNRSVLGWALVNRAQISLGMADLGAASRDLARAAALFDTLGDRGGRITATGFQGVVALEVGDTARARTLFRQLRDWAARDQQPIALADAHVSLADIAIRERDWATARRELRASQAVWRRSGGTEWARGLAFNEGVLALNRGDLRSAERLFRTELASLDSSQHSRRYLTLASLAEVALLRGDTAAAEATLRAASQQLDAWRATLPTKDLRLLAFQVRDSFGGRGPAIAAIIAGIATSGRVAAAFELAEHRRARSLVDELTRATALRLADDASAAAPRAAPVLDVRDVQAALPDARTALLEYVAGNAGQPTTLFVITRTGVRAHVLDPVDSLRASIERFATLVESGGEVRALGRRLGDALLRPALVHLPPTVTRLVIVPDDILYRVPFQVLIMADGRHLIERYATAITPSAAVAAALWRRPSRERPVRILAFGDPNFTAEGEPTRDAPRAVALAFGGERRLPRLPATAREVREVARFAPEAVVRVRDQASAAFLEHTPLESFRVIHFATHAVVDEHTVGRAAIALTPGGGESGFVLPGDLAALRLDADVVVLSACRTAGGVVLGGEGIRGLTAPLLQAGARSVLATQWPVSDRRTVSMVVAFYAGLADGLPAADALQRAALDAMRDGAPAREWAAFRLVGNPTVRVPLRRRSVVERWWTDFWMRWRPW